MNDISHNPSFKRDFAFIRHLENQNKAYQEKIWEKFVGTFNGNDDIRIVNTHFKSHPGDLSSESEKSIRNIRPEWENEALELSNSSLEIKSSPKNKSKSFSSSKLTLNDNERKQLKKKLTGHLQNGTLSKFDIKCIGDHTSVARKEEKRILDMDEHKEDHSDMWHRSNSLDSVSQTISDLSEKLSDTELNEKSPRIVESKLSKEIKKLRAELKMKEKVRTKTKSRTGTRKISSRASIDNGKLKIQTNTMNESKKSRYYIEKCIGVIKDISKVINNGISPPDGSDDYARRQVRTKEFISRFSRTYLYPLLTQLSQLNTIESGSSVCLKFTSLYQLTYQALQAYVNHIPNTVGNAAYQKLKECLKCALEICEKSGKYSENEANYANEDYISIFKSHCEDLGKKLDDIFFSMSATSLKHSRNLKPVRNNNKNITSSPNNRKDIQNRLSMYSSNLRQKTDKQWKRMLSAFEQRKPKVRSRYRTATFKHRPPVERVNSQIVIPPKQHRLDDEKSLGLLRNTPVLSPINEDQIQTMIQYENERLDGEEDLNKEKGEFEDDSKTFFVEQKSKDISEGVDQQEDILTRLLQLVQDDSGPNETENDLTKTIKVLQNCLSLKNQKTETLKKDRTEQNQKLMVHNASMEVRSENNEKKNKISPTVTVTGTKNAQLICIKDENSIMSMTDENVDSEDYSRGTGKTAEVQTYEKKLKEESKTPVLQKSKSSIKISRIKKPRKLLQLLPKTYAINIIQYKLMFYKHHKGDNMYKKTATTKPWELVNKISDELLDFALLGIAKEIEVNELLENLYRAEFQY